MYNDNKLLVCYVTSAVKFPLISCGAFVLIKNLYLLWQFLHQPIKVTIKCHQSMQNAEYN